MEPFAIVMIIIAYLFLIIFYYWLIITMWATKIFAYVMQAVSFSTIARRRGIEKPWLAWIPWANTWQVGKIADEYYYQVTGEDPNLRKTLLIQKIIYMAVCPALIVLLYVVTYVVAIAALIGSEVFGLDVQSVMSVFLIVFYGVFAIWCIATIVAGVVFFMTQYKALYRVYRSCNPETSLLFLILSFISVVTLTLCVFVDRHKDLGMPVKQYEISDQ